MLKNKIYILILLIPFGISSCGEYQKVLNKGKVEEQYALATKLYENQNYNKAIQLFEKVTPSYRNKPQMERIQFMIAQSHYNVKLYTLAAYYYDKFVKNYPKSSKIEEAAYFSAHSHFLASPVFSLDQKDTQEAITSLQSFMYLYPESKHITEANGNIKILTKKLEKKSFEIAKQYYHTEDYIAAIVAFDNLLAEFLGTSYKEEAMYLKFISAYKLGMNSFIRKKETRIKEAVKTFDRFKRSYPESKYISELNKLVKNLEKELNSVIALKTETNGL